MCACESVECAVRICFSDLCALCVLCVCVQVLLADPEERRSFMDMRLLLARGEMGDDASPASSGTLGFSHAGFSRKEPGKHSHDSVRVIRLLL